jgi:hypothetical protein
VKVIELKNGRPTVEELTNAAKDELVVLRKPDGSVFALSPVDDFDVEVALLKGNAEFMGLMKKLSRQKGAISLQGLRKELGLRPKKPKKPAIRK